MEQHTAPKALLYTRISFDAAGEGLGVERQEQMLRELAARRGWQVAEVITENSVSATRGVRPGFTRVLKAVERGEVDVVAAYHLDRLTRTLRDLAKLTDAIAAAPTPVRVETVASSELDLSSASGRLVANLLAAVATAEVERTSERLEARHAQAAAKGLPATSIPFGYLPGQTEDGHRTLVPDPDTAHLVPEIFKRAAAGEPLSSIGEWLTEQGVEPPRGGKRWHHNSLRAILNCAAYIGKRDHRGQGRTDGNWRPLISEELWADAHAAREAARPRRKPPERGRFAWTGLLECAHCGGTMYGSYGEKGRYVNYKCVDTCASISERRLEKALEGFAVNVAAGALEVALEEQGQPTPEGESVKERLEMVRARRQEAARLFAAGVLEADDYAAIVKELRAQEELLAQEDEPAGPSLDNLADALGRPLEFWRSVTSPMRRRLVEVVADAVVVASRNSAEPRVRVLLRQSSGGGVVSPAEWVA